MGLNQEGGPGSIAHELSASRSGDRVSQVIDLATRLVRIPSVTNCPNERLDEVVNCARVLARFMNEAGLEVRVFDQGRYPALLAGFPGALLAPINLCGHFDVVPPEPDDSQFEPRIEGDRLWGRGAADMKTVVASQLVWMRDKVRQGPPYPPFNLLLVGNEENGEFEPFGTPHVLAALERESGWQPELMVVGERTGEQGDELYGAVCPSSRGVARVYLTARGTRGHTGTGAVPLDLLDRFIEIRQVLGSVFERYLTMAADDGWVSSARFPFIKIGEPGVYNITAGEGLLGIELRPIPEDDVEACVGEVCRLCTGLGFEVTVEVMEAGPRCPPDNPHLGRLIESVTEMSGEPARLDKKKPGSSARFAPGGNAVVWGQSGSGPHSKDEWHYLPSIGPYLDVLDDFARRTMAATIV